MIRIIKSLKNGLSGWLLLWAEGGGPGNTPWPPPVHCSHWFADVDEAMAIKFAMQHGKCFEQARDELANGTLNVDAEITKRLDRRTARATYERARTANNKAVRTATNGDTVIWGTPED